MRTASTRHRRRTFVALAVSTALAAGLSPLDGRPASAATTAITAGSVTWGIKQSWRTYIGESGITVADGLTRNAAGEFVWPVTAGTFDDDDGSLVLDLGGTAHFEKYCTAGVCLLDSTFSDLSVSITPDEQVIRGTYAGSPQSNPGGPIETVEHVVLARIDLAGASPTMSFGTTTWPALPTVAGGPPFDLYPGGTAFDPATVVYEGPGGVPDPPAEQHQFAAPGAPGFTAGASWTAGDADAARRNVYVGSDSDVVHVTEFFGRATDVDRHLTVRALDAVTLQELTSVVVPLDASSPMYTAFDPTTESIFVVSGTATAATVLRARYVGGTTGYATEQVGQFTYTGTGTLARTYAMTWNPARSELALVVGAAGPDVFQRAALHTYRLDGNEAWTATIRPITVERTGLFAGATTIQPICGAPLDKTENLIGLADGSYLCASGTTFTAGTAKGQPLLWIRPAVDTVTASATAVDGTIPPPLGGINNQGWRGLSVTADGSVLLHSTIGYLPYQYVDLVAGVPTAVAPAAILSATQNGRLGEVASDSTRGFDYLFNREARLLNVFRDRQLVASLPFTDAVTPGPGDANPYPMAVTEDGSLIIQVLDAASGNVGLRRYDFAGITAGGITDPADQAVAIGVGVDSTPATFTSVAAAGDPAPVRQWQVKTPGAAAFVDVVGESGETLTVAAQPGMSGTQYRALFTNAAGVVASNPATLTVSYAPIIVHHAVDVTVGVGADAVFTIEATGDPAPSVSWQRQVDGVWQDVTAADSGLHVAGSTLTVTGGAAPTGSTYRAVVSNSVGTVYSSPATLTVAGGPSGPGSGEQQVTVDVAEAGSGAFAWEIPGAERDVVLGVAADAGDHWAASGALLPLTVVDTRSGGPAWSLSGQVSDFGSISGSHLGWTPQVIAPGAGAAAGAAVSSGFVSGNGLGNSAVLASAPAGHPAGSATVGAALDLRLPRDTPPGTYTATLTITALS